MEFRSASWREGKISSRWQNSPNRKELMLPIWSLRLARIGKNRKAYFTMREDIRLNKNYGEY